MFSSDEKLAKATYCPAACRSSRLFVDADSSTDETISSLPESDGIRPRHATPPGLVMISMEASIISREAFASCSSALSSGPSGIETVVSKVLPQSLFGTSSYSSLALLDLRSEPARVLLIPLLSL